jgi:hypothetical protein
MKSRNVAIASAVFLAAGAAAVPARVHAQARPDTIGPAVSWQLQAGGEVGLISGVLFTSAGQPVRGARVRVSGRDDWAESDIAGRFSLNSQHTGKIEVRIEALGYHTVRDSVFLPAGRSLFLSGVLREAVIRISPDRTRTDTLDQRRRDRTGTHGSMSSARLSHPAPTQRPAAPDTSVNAGPKSGSSAD